MYLLLSYCVSFQPMLANGVDKFRPRSAKQAVNPVIPEVEVYLHLLVTIHLIDSKQLNKVTP